MQDRFNTAKPGNRMARIRASRLTKSADPETTQDTAPGLVGENDRETKEKTQEIELKSDLGSPEIDLPTDVAAFEASPTLEEVEEKEEQPTSQLSVLPAKDHPPLLTTLPDLQIASLSSIEDQSTVQLLAVTTQSDERLLDPATSNPKDVENQLTQQLPISGVSSAKNLENQPTLPLPIASNVATKQREIPDIEADSTNHHFISSVFAMTRLLMRNGLTRLQESQPEGLATRGLQAVKPEIGLGLFPLLVLTNAVGLMLISIAFYLSQIGAFELDVLWLLGLLVIFVPNLLRLLMASPSRFERICLLFGFGLAAYLVSLLKSPLYTSSFDESAHWITANLMLSTGHLFGDNSMLPVSPYYPGLEIVTNAISSLTGLNHFYASIPLIASLRILLILSLFLFFEKLMKSSRMAGIAVMIYMTNPHSIFFDALLDYETMALPLAVCVLYILVRYRNTEKKHGPVIFAAWIVLMAVAFSHHMTDYVLNGLLLLWAIVNLSLTKSLKKSIHLLFLAVFGTTLAIAYAFLMPGNPVWSYLYSYFYVSVVELGHIIMGTSASRPLFTDTGGTVAPIWDRFFMAGSVLFIAPALPFGLVTLWRLYRRNALAMMLGIFVLAYPIAQAFRFTDFGDGIADRAAAFFFLAVAFVITILITHFWPTRQLNKKTMAFVSCIMAVVFLGGVIIDAGTGYSSLPGPYAIITDGRSIEPEGVNAALWALAYLGPGNRMGSDRTNQMIMGSYGEQRIVTELDDQVDVSPIFYSMQFNANDIAILREGKVKYLVVDLRLSTAIPYALKFYFVSDEPEANNITAPISSEALTKFNTVPQINRLFDEGDIVIYDTGAFLNGSGP